MRPIFALSCTSLLLAAMASAEAVENPADLDARFSTDGKLTYAFDVEGTDLSDFATALVPRANGALTLVGTVTSTGPTTYDVGMVNVGPIGEVQSTARGDRGVHTVVAAAAAPGGGLFALALAAQGGQRATVVRLDANGQPVASFGGEGTAEWPQSVSAGAVLDIAVGPQYPGPYVMLRLLGTPETGGRRMVMAFTANGSVPDFISLDSLGSDQTVGALQTDRDGNLAVVYTVSSASACKVRVKRFRARPALGGDAFTSLVADRDIPFGNEPCDFSKLLAAFDGSGRLVVLAEGSFFFLLARMRADGTLDTGFAPTPYYYVGGAGSTIFIPDAMAATSDGRIVLGGNIDDGVQKSMAVLRMTADGLPDNSFGIQGKVRVFFADKDGGNLESRLLDVRVDSVDRILGAGFNRYTGDDVDFATFRLAGPRRVFRSSFE